MYQYYDVKYDVKLRHGVNQVCLDVGSALQFWRPYHERVLIKERLGEPPPTSCKMQKSSVSTRLNRASTNLEQGHGFKASVPLIYQNVPWVLWNPESGIQLKESGIPQSDWIQESKNHWQGLESSFKTFLGSLTWDVPLINLMHPGSKNGNGTTLNVWWDNVSPPCMIQF